MKLKIQQQVKHKKIYILLISNFMFPSFKGLELIGLKNILSKLVLVY